MDIGLDSAWEAVNAVITLLWSTIVDGFFLTAIESIWEATIDFIFTGIEGKLLFMIFVAIFLFAFQRKFIE